MYNLKKKKTNQTLKATRKNKHPRWIKKQKSVGRQTEVICSRTGQFLFQMPSFTLAEHSVQDCVYVSK